MKRIFESFWLLLIGLVLVGAVYGGLTLVKFAKANDDTNQTTQEKVVALEKSLNEQYLKINDLEKELSDVKQLASRPKYIAGAADVNPAPTPAPAPAPEPIIQTVTKTVVVKEAPKAQASVVIQNVGSYKVELKTGDTAFSILKRASAKNGFPIEYQQYSFGVFVTSIANIKPVGNQYWAFYYNGQFSNVGASDQSIKNNDTTFWQLATF